MSQLFFVLSATGTLAAFLVFWPLRTQAKYGWVAMVLLLGFSLGLYGLLGAPRVVPLLAERDAKLEQISQDISRLSAATQREPKNIENWAELGSAFMESAQYSAAANAFKQTVLLSEGHPTFIMAYARALIAEKDGQVSELAHKSLQMVLLQQPGHPDARYFMAVYQLQNGKTEEAMQQMKSLYHSLPENSPLKAMIDAQIGR